MCVWRGDRRGQGRVGGEERERWREEGRSERDKRERMVEEEN